jgi:peptidoglycan L-alanyl-D-glutamate endopeptidase CwlK
MSFKLSTRSLKALDGVHPDLVRIVRHTIEETPVDFVVIEGLRTKARQAELVKSGASQTMDSRHITGHAVDLAAWVGSIRWDMGLYYQIAATVQRVSVYTGIPVRWGGAWVRLDTASKPPSELVADYAASARLAGKKAFIDAPHFELPKTLYPV